MKYKVGRLVEVVEPPPPTYALVFHCRPPVQGIIHGKAYLKRFHYHVYEKHCGNLKTVRSWLKVRRDAFVCRFLAHPNLCHDPEFLEELREFVKKRAPELAALVFLEVGIILYWKVEDIMLYLLGHKRYKSKLIVQASKTAKAVNLVKKKKKRTEKALEEEDEAH